MLSFFFIPLLFLCFFIFFFFNDTATTEIYTLSLHDALPICVPVHGAPRVLRLQFAEGSDGSLGDRKSTRLNSSHSQISYAVFCLKKKKNTCKVPLHNLSTLQAYQTCALR